VSASSTAKSKARVLSEKNANAAQRKQRAHATQERARTQMQRNAAHMQRPAPRRLARRDACRCARPGLAPDARATCRHGAITNGHTRAHAPLGCARPGLAPDARATCRHGAITNGHTRAHAPLGVLRDPGWEIPRPGRAAGWVIPGWVRLAVTQAALTQAALTQAGARPARAAHPRTAAWAPARPSRGAPQGGARAAQRGARCSLPGACFSLARGRWRRRRACVLRAGDFHLHRNANHGQLLLQPNPGTGRRHHRGTEGRER
jgi:hypothetical protein